MDITNAIDFLNQFRTTTENSKNKKNAEKFLRVLEELKFKYFTDNQIQRINSELDIIFKTFEIENEKINVKIELGKFLKFLKSEFSLTIPNYNLYFGMMIGVLISIFFGVLSTIVGLLVGAIIGYFLDQKAKNENRKLKTELDDFIF